jgi:hypothetical protein
VQRLVALATILVLAAVSCGDDSGGGGGGGGGGGDAEAFCDRLQELDDEDTLDLNDADSFAALEQLADEAPDDIDNEFDTLIDAAHELEDLDEDDPDSFERAFEIILNPSVLDALNEFGDFARDECGIEVPGTDVDPNNPFGDLSTDFSSDFSSDFSTDFSSDLSDDEPSNTDLLEAFLDENYGDEDWVDLITTRSVGTVADQTAQITLGLEEAVDGDTAVEVCEGGLAWGEDRGYDTVEVEIQGPDQETLADGNLDDGCEAA